MRYVDHYDIRTLHIQIVIATCNCIILNEVVDFYKWEHITDIQRHITNRIRKETEYSTSPMISISSVLTFEKTNLIHDNVTPWSGDWHIARPLHAVC